MTTITEKITENDVCFEIYADGDCVIQVDKPGFFQISQDMISKIYKSRKLKEASLGNFNPLQSILNRSSLVKKDHKSLVIQNAKSEVNAEFKPGHELANDAFQPAAGPSVEDNVFSPAIETLAVKFDEVLTSAQPKISTDVKNLSKVKVDCKKAVAIENSVFDEKLGTEDVADSEEKIKRSLVAPTIEGEGWSCTMRVKGQEPILYKYTNRRFARAADPADEIGQNGRIS